MQIPEWAKILLLALVSIVSGIVAWAAKRAIGQRDKEIEALKSEMVTLRKDMENLLRLVPILESLESSLRKESSDRKEIEAQIWAKLNKTIDSITKAQNEWQQQFMTKDQFDRLEKSREKTERFLENQNMRIENTLQDVQRALVDIARKTGMT